MTLSTLLPRNSRAAATPDGPPPITITSAVVVTTRSPLQQPKRLQAYLSSFLPAARRNKSPGTDPFPPAYASEGLRSRLLESNLSAQPRFLVSSPTHSDK